MWYALVAALAVQLNVHPDTLAEIRQRGALRWGDDAEGGAPYIFHPPDQPDRLTGFEVDFAAALCTRLGVRSEFVQQNWDMLVPALGAGHSFDVIIAGLERNPDNLRRIAMSRPYFVFAQQLVVRRTSPDIHTLSDLRGRRLGVLSASTSHHLAAAAGGIELKIYQDNVNYFQDLELGRLDAVLTDTPIAQAYTTGKPALRYAGPPFSPGFYAIGVRPADTNLLTALDDAITHLVADGTLERIYRRYDLWHPGQSALATWQPESSATLPAGSGTNLATTAQPGTTVTGGTSHSALREWRTYLPVLLRASVTTLWVTCAAMALAIVWGLTLALLRLHAPAPVRWATVAYIEVFRGTPLLLQIYFLYFGLAQQLGVQLSAGLAAVLSLGLNYAAAEAENYRAGIQAVPAGQTEAALALGMSRWVALRRVILPQALRISLPSVTNDFIALFKDSSIVSVIALVELTKEYQIRALDSGDYLGMGILTAAIYFALGWLASLAARQLERSWNRDRR